MNKTICLKLEKMSHRATLLIQNATSLAINRLWRSEAKLKLYS